MNLQDFDYELPESLIAKSPVSPRDHSRLLIVNRATQAREHRHFYELESHLRKGDVLVLNNTKVLPARLFGTDAKGRRFEVLLLRRLAQSHLDWSCLARPGKKISGQPLQFPAGVTGHLTRREDRDFNIRFEGVEEAGFLSWLSEAGSLPIPPYLKRDSSADDTVSYQTVYAKDAGSVAAPTAGLHFTTPLLAKLREKGIQLEEVTLHVGYGTFSPIKAENIEAHEMHEEEYEIPLDVLARIKAAKAEGRRIIAVGTTSMRTLESLDLDDDCGPTSTGRGATRLFIYPGYRFRWVDGLITNFHLPKSSLYVLVAAFLGLEATRDSYREAIHSGYRFFSYGDAMAILP